MRLSVALLLLKSSSAAFMLPAAPVARHTRALTPKLALPNAGAAALRPAERLAGVASSFRQITSGGDLLLSRVELSLYLVAAAMCGSAVTAVVFVLRERRRQQQAAADALGRGAWREVVTDVGKRAISDAQVTAAWLGPKAEKLAAEVRQASGTAAVDVLNAALLSAVLCEAAQVRGNMW